MKKSLLNITVTMALSGAVFSGAAMSTQAYAGDYSDSSNDNSINNTTETYMYPGMGVGAATGALIAGPAGLLVGGIIGAIAGANQDATAEPESIAASPENASEQIQVSESNEDNRPQAASVVRENHPQGLQFAQLGAIDNIVDESVISQQEKLIDILTADFSLDVYFRSGSTDIEAFYPSRLDSVAQLIDTMDQLEINLEGYSDRRGDRSKNIELSKMRIEEVREQLINAGVDENRIVSKAFGEMKMVSAAGDLEAYTFDRKVVIRFQRITADSISAMTTALSESETNDAEGAARDVSESTAIAVPVVADANAAF